LSAEHSSRSIQRLTSSKMAHTFTAALSLCFSLCLSLCVSLSLDQERVRSSVLRCDLEREYPQGQSREHRPVGEEEIPRREFQRLRLYFLHRIRSSRTRHSTVPHTVPPLASLSAILEGDLDRQIDSLYDILKSFPRYIIIPHRLMPFSLSFF
jgi:hypothetical protein